MICGKIFSYLTLYFLVTNFNYSSEEYLKSLSSVLTSIVTDFENCFHKTNIDRNNFNNNLPKKKRNNNRHYTCENESRDKNKYCVYLNGKWTVLEEFKKKHPSAVRCGPAKLKNHRLDWNNYDINLGSDGILLVEDCGYDVWGTIYFIDKHDWKNITTGYNYEYVSDFPIIRTLELRNGKKIKCWSFAPKKSPAKLAYGEPFPSHRRPTKEVIDFAVRGLKETGVPKWYIDGVSNIPVMPYEENDPPSCGCAEDYVIKPDM